MIEDNYIIYKRKPYGLLIVGFGAYVEYYNGKVVKGKLPLPPEVKYDPTDVYDGDASDYDLIMDLEQTFGKSIPQILKE